MTEIIFDCYVCKEPRRAESLYINDDIYDLIVKCTTCGHTRKLKKFA